MKILICTSFLEQRVNGTALFPNFALKINELYPQHEVRVLTDDASQSYDKVFRVEFKYPRPIQAFYSLLTNFSYYKALKKIQKEYDFDIVVFNHSASGVWTRWFLPKRIKVLGFIHDDDSLKLKKENHLKKRHYVIQLIKKHLEFLAIRYFNGLLCPSNYIKDILIKDFKFNETKIKLLYQSIDVLGIEYEKERRKLEKKIKILFVKSAFLRGGLFDLMESIKYLPQYEFELTIVGANAYMKDKVNGLELQIQNLKVNLKGYCPPDAVSAMMYENDILCVPSRAEVLGLANVEGLAHGIRVVATNVGGIPEVMNDGNNGWMAEPLNPTSLAQAIQDCIESSPSVFHAKSEAGRRFVEEKFDYRNMLKRFIEISEKL
jgi:colanic acid/amylovoran biosynthesis glycosyltransferase